MTTGASGVALRLEAGASGWSVTVVGAGEALEEVAGVEAFEASPIANLARSLSSRVVRVAGRGLGAGAAADSGGVVLAWAFAGLAGR